MQADGCCLDDKRTPQPDKATSPTSSPAGRSAIPERIGAATAPTRAFWCPRAEIAANDYDLSINRYKEVAYEAVEYDAPKVILKRLVKLEEEIAKGRRVREDAAGPALLPKFPITDAIARDLTVIERARGFLEARVSRMTGSGRMHNRASAARSPSHHTHRGHPAHARPGRADLGWQTIPSADADDVRELLNYRGAFELARGYLGSPAPITEAVLREIHNRLVHGVRGDSARPGQYRHIQNYVANNKTGHIVYTPPPPQEVAPMMQQLVSWLNAPTTIHPVLAAGIAQFQLVHIHPFIDGNGRTSRLLSTICLYRSGYDFKGLFTLSEFYDRDRPAFYAALQSVRKTDLDLTGWLEFFSGGLATQLTEVKTRGDGDPRLI